ncbi:hypothetical protein [Persicitalea sp.]|uniref:hypothetical protein n=1 Tax=Persicitalea sp. TaxID=3100273 RepID=UPI00359328B3
MKLLIFPLLLIGVGLTNLQAQNPVGIFENHADVGPVLHPGAATYDNASRTYALSGAGANIWFKKDELHFAWKKIKGDFLLTTQPMLEGKGVDPHRKSGWMARTSLDTSAAMVSLTVHGDGLTAFQYRKKGGTNIEEVKIPMVQADIIQLERRGRSYFVSVAKLGMPFWTVEVPDFDFPEELMVGLFIGSHNKDVVEKGLFRETRVFTPIK